MASSPELRLSTSQVTLSLHNQVDEHSTGNSTMSSSPSTFSFEDELSNPFLRQLPSALASSSDFYANSSSRFLPLNAQLIYPKSRYVHGDAQQCVEEHRAVQELLKTFHQQNTYMSLPNTNRYSDDFVEFRLSNFVAYMPGEEINPRGKYPFEMRPLQDLVTKAGHNQLLFDGTLSVGASAFSVQGIPFQLCSIGNYGEEHHEVGGDIWIKSEYNKDTDTWYRLVSSAPEYERFHEGFLHIADLAKHFVDYLSDMDDVSIHDFRNGFSRWLHCKHGESVKFQAWYAKFGRDDLRSHVAKNIHFLFNECVNANAGDEYGARAHSIWSEVKDVDFIPKQDEKATGTIVTPYVYNQFKHMRFGHLLVAQQPSSKIVERCTSMGIHLNLDQTSNNSIHRDANQAVEATTRSVDRENHDSFLRTIRPGDVISVPSDSDQWKNYSTTFKAASDVWRIYVLGLTYPDSGKASDILFSGIWLYEPEETICGKGKYPYPNELFFSNHCNCEHPIQGNLVRNKTEVVWHGQPNLANHNRFVRQTYVDSKRFVTFKDEHRTCKHFSGDEVASIERRYPIGSTVVATPPNNGNVNLKFELEPYEVINYSDNSEFVTLRKLLRRGEMAGQTDCRPNELVYTSEIIEHTVKSIKRDCLVRIYTQDDIVNRRIPAVYSNDGTGFLFYITTRLNAKDCTTHLKPILEDLPGSLIQGFDPSVPPPFKPLRCLDTFCGGGNFVRGLEEAGAAHTRLAVDYAAGPIHTYYANLKSPNDTRFWHGSVNDLLLQALQNNPTKSGLIPLPGDIDLICAGSPCQGYSSLNALKNNEKGLKNQSLVTNLAANVDLYRPKYGLLENVVKIAKTDDKTQNSVLSQFICCIVGLGYQLEVYFMDAWSYGSPQSRTRIFVSFAAPGLVPVENPSRSHSHPPTKTLKGRRVGELANGAFVAERDFDEPTAFSYRTARDSVADLPNGHQYSIRFPNHHHPYGGIPPLLRCQIAAIPRYPRGSNFAMTWYGVKDQGREGTMTQAERGLFPPIQAKSGKERQAVLGASNAWGRIHPHGLFETIPCHPSPEDALMGKCLHWDENRPYTLMEAMRAQGFRDEDVIVGSGTEQMKIVGNSVARQPAIALGLGLREAMMQNHLAQPSKGSAKICCTQQNIRVRSKLDGIRLSTFQAGNCRASACNKEVQDLVGISSSEYDSTNSEDELANTRDSSVGICCVSSSIAHDSISEPRKALSPGIKSGPSSDKLKRPRNSTEIAEIYSGGRNARRVPFSDPPMQHTISDYDTTNSAWQKNMKGQTQTITKPSSHNLHTTMDSTNDHSDPKPRRRDDFNNTATRTLAHDILNCRVSTEVDQHAKDTSNTLSPAI